VTAGAYERLVVASQAFLDAGWLPPAADCPELANLRAEHERLLEACRAALAQLGEARQAADDAAEARVTALREAFVAGSDPKTVKLPLPDRAPVEEAARLYEAASEALEQFVLDAQREIAARSSSIRSSIEARVRSAAVKRAEARALLAEADRLDAEPKRLSNWLDRYTGDSVLGPYAFELLDVPVREPVPELFQEIAGLAPGDVIDVGSDELTEEELEAIRNAQ
jgi:hypothetical protein